jgi:hypothetical protein
MYAELKSGFRCLMWGALLLSLGAFSVAQDDPLEPGHQDVSPALVTFELNWPASNPQSYVISVQERGRASYQSQPRAEQKGDSQDLFTMDFIASEPTRTKIFELAKELNYFHGDFETKYKVANTGNKTLTYRDGGKESKTTVNYSSNPRMNELIEIFQKMSTTFEMSRKLDYDIRFDKLGLDRDLKAMEELNKSHYLIELQVISPTLERIANDPSVMNISRQRARRLLGQAQVAIGSY